MANFLQRVFSFLKKKEVRETNKKIAEITNIIAEMYLIKAGTPQWWELAKKLLDKLDIITGSDLIKIYNMVFMILTFIRTITRDYDMRVRCDVLIKKLTNEIGQN